MRHLSSEHKRNIAIALKGNKNNQGNKQSEETREKIRTSRKKRFERLGYLNSTETRKKMSEARKGKPAWNKGKKMPASARKKMSEAAYRRLADPRNHYNWKGGKSFEPYTSAFTKQLKQKIKGRDDYTCQLCGMTEEDYFQKLSIHHIDYNKDNCDTSNLITLCRSCNAKANFKRKYWSNLFKEKVQRL